MAGRVQRLAERTPVRLAAMAAAVAAGAALLFVTVLPDQADVTRAAEKTAAELTESGADRYSASFEIQAALDRGNPTRGRSGSVALFLDVREAESTTSENRFEISRYDGAHPVCIIAADSGPFTAAGIPPARFSVHEGPC